MNIKDLEKYDFKKVGNAIIVKDLPNDVYHAGLGVSSSSIRRFGESQLHAIEQKLESSPTLKFGTAAHSYLLEGEEAFKRDVVIMTGSPYTKANKELKEEYEANGLIVLKESDMEIIQGMKDNMIYEGNAYINAKDKIAESSIYWYEDDVICKCRPDVLCKPIDKPRVDNEIIIVDYKTTQSCDPRQFGYSVRKYGYDLQAAFYRRGVEAAGYKVKEFVFVAQEKVHPYAAKVFRITQEHMDYAWHTVERYLEEYKEYKKGKPLTIYNSPNVVDLEI